MVDPALALGVFAVAVLTLAVSFWPSRGVWARWRRLRQASLRVRMEDALKHLYKSEHDGTPFSLEGLAGALEISRVEASWTLAALRERGLVRLEGGAFPLTQEGRDYGVQIVRTHRLVERFLADRTGVEPGAWHDVAEEREHSLSPAEVDALATSLGHPRFDPHGDPIPTPRGEMPALDGVALAGLREGQEGVILHLEDEPPETYHRLLGLGLAPHIELRVRSVDDDGTLHVEVDGSSVGVDPVSARNVTVALRPIEGDPREGLPTLADLRPGGVATVLGISPKCQGVQRRRLLDLGVVPGTAVTAELHSATGDPVAYLIRGALIALRRDQAEWIQVELGKAA
jgi:DtxR family Mn-dependent transcriptional regulator